ncbi:hypothetical protein [Actinomadura sp. 6N118]|uniref:effector-associated constant component EACC1 n=1 Tax=Actinomadura sp. 6N118 TaxID=3375151 RepID=UPI00378EF5B3
MVILLRVDGTPDDQELYSLHDWLRAERQLRGRTTVNLQSAPPRPGEMGAGIEAVEVAITAAGSIATVGELIALSVRSWRRSRPNEPRVTIEYQGRTITGTPTEIAETLKALDDDQA